VGGLIGAGFCKGGSAVIQSGVLKTALFIVISPVLGMLLGASLMVLVAWLFRRKQPGRIDRWFRRLQLLSSALFSLGHGGNDAQKTMGIIMATLIAKGYLGAKAEVPLWVILSCHAAMGLGTLSGGWRIVKTMGMRLTKLKRSAASAPRPARPACCSSPAEWACRCRPPTRSRGPSWASAGSTARPGCAGASRFASCGPGCSPSRPPR
jgi:phosphate/sulfate permease